jgi:hypothetical protein
MKALALALTFLVFPLPAIAADAAAKGAEPTSGEYRIVVVAVSGQAWDAIRYNAATGKAAVIAGGKWQEIKEPKGAGPLPRSEYQVHMVSLAQDWGAVRMDVRSGRSWRATPQGWEEIIEAP